MLAFPLRSLKIGCSSDLRFPRPPLGSCFQDSDRQSTESIDAPVPLSCYADVVSPLRDLSSSCRGKCIRASADPTGPRSLRERNLGLITSPRRLGSVERVSFLPPLLRSTKLLAAFFINVFCLADPSLESGNSRVMIRLSHLEEK